MRIAYLNALHLPTMEVDPQQVVKMMSAFSEEVADIEPAVPHSPSRHCLAHLIPTYLEGLLCGRPGTGGER